MRHRSAHKQLNVKLAIGLPVTVVALIGGVLVVHAMQIHHTARAMLRKGEQAESAGDLDEAIKYYDYYVRYESKDDRALGKLALLLAQRARKPGASGDLKKRAYQILENAATRDPDNLELLGELADLCYELRFPQRAAVHYERLRQHAPDDSSLGVKLALCQIGTERYREAMTTLEQVIGQDRLNIRAYVELANLLKKHLDDADAADSRMNQMVAENPKTPLAYVARARFRQEAKDTDRAQADIDKAYSLDPTSLDVLLGGADLAVAVGDRKKAREYLDRANSLYPENEQVHEARARLSQIARDLTAAEEELLKVKDARALPALFSVRLQQGDLKGARETIKKMEKVPYRPEIIEFFEAQVLVAERQWRKAARALERIRPDVERIGDLGKRTDMLLGLCYDQLGLPDRQIAVYQRLLDQDPLMVTARIGYASALLRAGQLERAVIEFHKTRNKPELEACYKSATLRTAIFRLLMADATRVPEAERNWGEVEQFLEKVAGIEGMDPVQLALMRADLLVKQEKVKEARALVQALCDKDPKNSGLCSTLVALIAMDEGPKEAMQVLDRVQGNLGGGVATRLMRAGLAARIGGDEGKAILAALAADADSVPTAERPELWERLGIAFYILGDQSKAADLWKKAAAVPGADARIQMALFELARERGDKTGMVEAADAIKDTLSSRSAEWNYCEAARLVWLIQNKQIDEKSLVRAKQFLQDANLARPNWHKLLLLDGEIAAMEKRPDDAIRCYQQASMAGQLDAAHLYQLVQLLYARGRYDEAKQAMEKLGDHRAAAGMDRIRVELDERTGQLEKALELAARTVAGSTKATDFLWYGHLLVRAKKLDEAEKAFRRCLELGPQIGDGWLSLVALLAARHKMQEAEQAVREAQVQLPEDRTATVLAQCYEVLGQLDRAEQQYRHAIEVRPDDLGLLERVAGFYMRTGQPEKAASHLNDMLQVAGRDPKKHRAQLIWARRSLARALAVTGDYRHHLQALRLLDQNVEGTTADPDDLRLKATVLAKRPEREARQQAIDILEGLQKGSQSTGGALSTDEQFLLGQLYESVGNWSECQRQMLDLLARNVKDPRLLAAYVDMLFRHGTSPRDMKTWVGKLESLAPNAPVTVAAKARMLVNLRQTDEAIKVIKASIPRPLPTEQVTRLRDAAALLEEIRQYELAEELLKEFAEKAPGGSIVLADFYSRHGGIDEGLAQCEAALGALRVESILASAVTILANKRTRVAPEHFRKVEGWIQQALDENPRSKPAQMQLARLMEIEGKYDDLVRTYRAFLSRDDLAETERAAVWNNLAFVLAASQRDPKEALEMVNQAIGVLGPVPNLLDTQAMAYLALGKNDAAVRLLREAISDSPTGLRYFHLALAHVAANDLEAAAKAMQVGKESHQLSIEQVPEIERARYRELLKKIESL